MHFNSYLRRIKTEGFESVEEAQNYVHFKYYQVTYYLTSNHLEVIS